jgi:hypothetical protein
MSDDPKKLKRVANIKEATIDEVMTWYTGDECWGSEGTFESILCNIEIDGDYADYEMIKDLWNNREDKIEVTSKCTHWDYDIEFKHKSKLYSLAAVNEYPNTDI